MMSEVLEHALVDHLTQSFVRSPLQLNGLRTSDAEIVRLTNASTPCLAITTDTVAEEIASGLYTDPYLIGWMAVMVNLSDLAAVGARPLGVLISQILPSDLPYESLARLQLGIANACAACDTHVLGGDTNSGSRLILSGTAVGILSTGEYLSRLGCQAGDVLYATAPLGTGNAFALESLDDLQSRNRQRGHTPEAYRPIARLAEGQLLTHFASACMDTSDGMLTTLDELVRLNGTGFELDLEWSAAIHPYARECAKQYGIPDWLFLAGHHGEFELCFTIPLAKDQAFRLEASRQGWMPIRIGRVIDEPSIRIPIYGRIQSIDTGHIRNLAYQLVADPASYVDRLLTFDNELRKGV